jgi:dolichyl-phosphate-mannose-protein mannosyltransferase
VSAPRNASSEISQDPRDALGQKRVQTRLVATVLALALAAAFAGVLLQAVDFPLGTTPDEPSKALQILELRPYNYNHPLLMLDLARAANAFAGLSDVRAVAELGRALAVVAGALAIFATFLLACEVLPGPTALAAACATAALPAMTVHARYFKEDIFALPFLLIALVALIETLKAPTRARSLMLGGAIGLAAGAKYVAFIALPFAVAFLLLDAPTKEVRRGRLALSAFVALAALAVFALIELPALIDYGQFQASLDGNLVHAVYGHDVRLPLSLTFGVFHLRHSLVPGLGWPLLILGLLGIATPWLAPPERRRPLIVISLFALVWYAAHELSPLKPFPGFARYMVPVAPLLVILGGAFIYELARRRWTGNTSALIAAGVLLGAALPALYLSLRVNAPLQENPRSVISALDFGDNGRIAFDSYTRFAGPAGTVASTPPDATTADIFVTSSFRYGRFADAGGRTQRGRTRNMAARYAALFEKPYLEVTNGRPAYAFFNPVLRIVALDGDPTRLQPIASKLRKAAPGFGIRLVNGSEVGRQ